MKTNADSTILVNDDSAEALHAPLGCSVTRELLASVSGPNNADAVTEAHWSDETTHEGRLVTGHFNPCGCRYARLIRYQAAVA